MRKGVVHFTPFFQRWHLGMCRIGLSLALVAVLSGVAYPGDRELGTIELVVDLVLGGEGASEEYFLGDASSVVEDPDGNIYVSDTKQQAILKFSPDGQFLNSMTSVGEGPGDLMPSARLAIGPSGQLYFAGQGGRVQVVDSGFRPVGSFQRVNPAAFVRGIAVLEDGSVAICAFNSGKKTTIDLYSPAHEYVRSFSDSFGKGKDLPWMVEMPYSGGVLALLDPENIVYAQLAPYSIRVFDSAGRLVAETFEGGVGFVPEPPMPDLQGDRISYRTPPLTTGVAIVQDECVLVGSRKLDDENQWHNLLCLYDRNLTLLATRESTGNEFVVASARGGRAYLVQMSDAVFVLVRVAVRFAKT